MPTKQKTARRSRRRRRKNPSKFTLRPIDHFDARVGFKRHVLPGVGVLVGRNHATADLWVTKDARIQTRFSQTGYKACYEVFSGGKPPTDPRLIDDLADYLADKLRAWMDYNKLVRLFEKTEQHDNYGLQR